MPYVNPSTFVAGEVLTAAQQNVLAANDRFFHGPPTARVRRAAALSITQNSWEEISFDTEDWDSDALWSSTAATKMFCRTEGKHLVTFTGGITSSTAGTVRGIGIRKNSTTGEPTEGGMFIREPPGAGIVHPMVMTQIVSLTTGQYIQGVVFQDHSAALNTSTLYGGAILSMLWVSS